MAFGVDVAAEGATMSLPAATSTDSHGHQRPQKAFGLGPFLLVLEALRGALNTPKLRTVGLAWRFLACEDHQTAQDLNHQWPVLTDRRNFQ